MQIDVLKLGGATGAILLAREVRRRLDELGASIVHAHYATTYGLLARRVGRPYILSVWGSDVFEFPLRSPWHRRVLIKNLTSASIVCATSRVMARRVQELTADSGSIDVTPFGVDVARFTPAPERRSDTFVVGTVKALYPCYGIDILIRAFAYLRGLLPDARKAQLLIVGQGPEEGKLRRLVRELALEGDVVFRGHVPNSEVPEVLRGFDVFACLSREESFGVAALEAAASGLPVIATTVGGLPEVVEDNGTGLLVPPEDPKAAAEALRLLAVDRALARRLGKRGREMVEAQYSREIAVAKMERVYRRFIDLST